MGQYFPGAFAAAALPAVFRQQGLPLESYWVLALPLAPRLFKWLMALAVDNYGSATFGLRKSWILPCTLIGAALYVAAGFVEPSTSTLYLIVGLLVLKSFVMGAQDVAVDGYAAESLGATERSIGTSIIVFLALVGTLLGQSCMALIGVLGWRGTLLLASALLLLSAIPALVRAEPPPPEAAQARIARGERPSLINALRRRDSGWILPYLFAFGFAGTYLASLFPAFLVDQGLSLTEIGFVVPIATLVGWGGGALVTPLAIGRFGLRKTALLGVGIYLIEGPVYFVLARQATIEPWVATILLTGIGLGLSLYHYAVNNSRFRWASKGQAATDFSLHSSLWSLAARGASGLETG